jgi:hypothetical protein
MGRKPKADGGKAKEPTQAERFIETARRIGADETGKAFEEAFDKIAQQRRPKIGRSENRPKRPTEKPQQS